MGRILIIGGNGFVGGRLVKAGKENGHQCAVLDVAENADDGSIPYYRCDISDEKAIGKVFAEFSPDIAVNVAAIADVDRAEKCQELAYSINVHGARNCAAAAKGMGCKYLWISSDAVFSGEDAGGYDEQATPAPGNYYGKTKMLGEQAVLVGNSDAIILRISLVLGFPVKTGNSFLAGLHKRLASGEEVNASTLEIRTPVDVLTLCEAIYELCAMDYKGVLHIGSTESLSRFELTTSAAELLAGRAAVVKPISETDASKAPRHRLGILNVAKAESILKRTKLLDARKTIERACSTLV